MRHFRFPGVGLFLALASTSAHADVVWPALMVETRLFSWWAILLGLIAEYVIIRWLFSLSIERAVIATTAANAVSALAGVLLIPFSGLILATISELAMRPFLEWATFNRVLWCMTFLLACLVNTWIEALVYKRGFKLIVRRREFAWIYVANAISVGIAFASVILVPVRL